MAGYSKTPLSKKLGIKAGHRVALMSAPAHLGDLLNPLPEGVTLLNRPRSRVNVIIGFCQYKPQLGRVLERGIRLLKADGGFWLAWPKKASSLASDLDFQQIQHAGLSLGLVDNKVCAIDDDWSGLRFVVRVENRKDWPA